MLQKLKKSFCQNYHFYGKSHAIFSSKEIVAPIDHNQVKNGVETIYRLHKDKGKAYVAKLFKKVG